MRVSGDAWLRREWLAHLDVWPNNLIWAGSGPVLLDWAFVGDGAVGEDIGNLAIDSVADGLIDIARLPDLVDAVAGGYRRGIGAAASAQDVSRGIHASAAAKYTWFAPQVIDRVSRDVGVGSGFYDAGGTVAEKLERWRPMLELLVTWAADALR